MIDCSSRPLSLFQQKVNKRKSIPNLCCLHSSCFTSLKQYRQLTLCSRTSALNHHNFFYCYSPMSTLSHHNKEPYWCYIKSIQIVFKCIKAFLLLKIFFKWYSKAEVKLLKEVYCEIESSLKAEDAKLNIFTTYVLEN